jgi:hypothetical protein
MRSIKRDPFFFVIGQLAVDFDRPLYHGLIGQQYNVDSLDR